MSRTKTEGAGSFEHSSARSVASSKNNSDFRAYGSAGTVWIGRAAFLVCLGALAVAWQLFGFSRWTAAVAGFAVALALVIVEMRLRKAEIRAVAGGALGGLAGIGAALLVALIVSRMSESDSTKSLLEIGSLLSFGYIGLFLGAAKGIEIPSISSQQMGGAAGLGFHADSLPKLLDTSVLIDGRIAD